MDFYFIKALAKGLLSFIPGASLLSRREGGGAGSARYCYSVWLRHLVLAHSHGMRKIPGVVAELGPGDSLGIGIAAMLSGVNKYYAFDVVKFIRFEKNQKILDELMDLFRARAPIPNEQEFPHLFPRLEDYSFPERIIDDGILAKSLAHNRISEIRAALKNTSLACDNASLITYSVPWNSASVLCENSIDFILSQAVLEHVEELENAYTSMCLWLKPGGYISHEIDFKSHGTAHVWNGHWCYKDFMWRIIRGKRAYLLNREPLSSHIRQLQSSGFDLKLLSKVHMPIQSPPVRLAPRFAGLDDDDLTTCSAYLLACKEEQRVGNCHEKSCY
ncbi:MAG: methyltransferase domain-containing protein [Deltaproteobacteria bacterium]|nr:methyltransferase domain-containing protein [Deltaproteobacteria bacterium]